MYLMYVDECGDSGLGRGSSRYFILSGMVVHEAYWSQTLESIHKMRKEIEGKYGLPVMKELHAGEMLGRTSKKYSDIPKRDRFLLFRDVLSFESAMDKVRVINVVVDKEGKTSGFNPFETAWDTLINRLENTIEKGNFPNPYGTTARPFVEKGMLIVDQTDEKKLRTLIRRMRHGNFIPSQMGIGTVRHDLRCVIEDPLHKQSEWSPIIQLCDANSYFLKQTIDPSSAVIKHKARNYFYKLEPILLKQATSKNELGIVFR